MTIYIDLIHYIMYNKYRIVNYYNEDVLMERGFTLAEVLVTLGIIGVVSAMTLPTLVKNHQRQVYVTQLQKVVTELSQAAEKAINDNNAISLEETKYNYNNANAARDFFNDYFKVVQTCTSTRTPCMAGEYKQLDGSSFDYWLFDPSATSPCVSIASGATICMAEGVYCDPMDNKHDYTALYIDINGAQGPNIVGRDLFYAELYSDGKIAESYTNDYHSDYCGESDATYGMGCLTKIMQDGWKMDY